MNFSFANIASGFSYCMECYVAVLLFLIIIEQRSLYWLRALAVTAAFFVISCLVYPLAQADMGIRSFLWYATVYALLLPSAMFLNRIVFYEAVYAVSMGLLTQHLGSSLYLMVAMNGNIPEFTILPYYLTMAAVYAMVFFFIARKLPIHKHYEIGTAFSIVMAVLVVVVVYGLSIVAKRTSIDGKGGLIELTDEYIQLFHVTQLYAALVCLVFLMLQRLFKERMVSERHRLESDAMWRQHEKQYEVSKENIEVMNRKVHDLKHQIAALATEEGLSERRKAFVEEVQQMVEVYDSDLDTGYAALDTILMEKSLFASMHGVEWTCVADGKLLEFMDVVDLFTLVGNALDNALEATCRLPADSSAAFRAVDVLLCQRENFALFQVENSFSGEIKEESGRLQTVKKDKANHGYGLKSIEAIAEKYGGSMSTKIEGQDFVLSVLLPIEE